jgi:nitrogen fixation NifU-like protein
LNYHDSFHQSTQLVPASHSRTLEETSASRQNEPGTWVSSGHNPLCGDTIELTVQLNQTGDRISDVKFEGEGCAIAIASADLMADAVRGKSVEEALSMVQRFRGMVMGQEQFPEDLRKLNVLQGISQFPVRIKCATLSWHTLKALLESSSRKLTRKGSDCATLSDPDIFYSHNSKSWHQKPNIGLRVD